MTNMIEMACDMQEHLIRKHDVFTVTGVVDDGVLIQSPKTDKNIKVTFDQCKVYMMHIEKETSRMDIIGQNGNDGIHYDAVNNPQHYNAGKIECIEVSEQFNFCLGNAIKYIWRCEHKGKKFEDLKKAIWYLEREIKGEK